MNTNTETDRPSVLRPAFSINARVKCRVPGCRDFVIVPAGDQGVRICDGCIRLLEADVADMPAEAPLPVVRKPTEVGADEAVPPSVDDEDEVILPVAKRRGGLFDHDAIAVAQEPQIASNCCAFCVDAAVEACDEEGCGKPLCGGCASEDHRCPEHA